MAEKAADRRKAMTKSFSTCDSESLVLRPLALASLYRLWGRLNPLQGFQGSIEPIFGFVSFQLASNRTEFLDLSFLAMDLFVQPSKRYRLFFDETGQPARSSSAPRL